MHVQLSDFPPPEREAIRTLYTYLDGVYQRWLEIRDHPGRDAAMQEPLMAFLQPPLSDLARGLGTSVTHDQGSPEVKKAIHDIRGGALTALGLYVHLLREDDANDEDSSLVRTTVFLARDHAKMMRNALPDLDPEQRQQDEEENPHRMEDVEEKWQGHRYLRATGEEGQVDVECSYSGLLASCCLEASAVDRLIYNYMNNAVRFAAGSEIRLEIYSPSPEVVRWVVINPIDPQQKQWLDEHMKGDLSRLFRGGITRGGRGVGLSNCADFVAAAFGLSDAEQALTQGYLGATTDGLRYVAWAHWPSLASTGTRD